MSHYQPVKVVAKSSVLRLCITETPGKKPVGVSTVHFDKIENLSNKGYQCLQSLTQTSEAENRVRWIYHNCLLDCFENSVCAITELA